jgi:UDP-N-acetyl-D-galactosamine dehydrogenase
VNVHVYDPHASPNEVAHEYGLTMADGIGKEYDAVVVAVAHQIFKEKTLDNYRAVSKSKLLLFDLKGLYDRGELNEGEIIWRL